MFITIELIYVEEKFLLREGGFLEKIALDAEIPRELAPFSNSIPTQRQYKYYVDEGDGLRPTDAIGPNEEPYQFKHDFAVYWDGKNPRF